jgi:hypothetical protein
MFYLLSLAERLVVIVAEILISNFSNYSTGGLIGKQEYTVNINLLCNFLCKGAFPMRKQNSGLLFHIA